MIKIPFGNLKRQYQNLQSEIDQATRNVYESGWFILGQQVKDFERNFAQYCRAKYAVGVGSGTEALHLALVAAGIQPGDEVITVANTCVPTLSAISAAGAMPILVDINPQTFTIDTNRIEERINSKTKAIIPVHLYGQCADMKPILEIARKYGLVVIEDCAQAHGAKYNDNLAGTMGDAGAFSFYPSKNLGAFGDGGLVVTNNQVIGETVTKLRNYGQEKRYHHSIKGFNSRLDELQAAILNVKLSYLDSWNQRRREIAQLYHQAFAQIGMTVPFQSPPCYHVYHLYVIVVPERDRFQELLAKEGISTLIHYPIPIHQQTAYQECGNQSKYLPITEKLARQIISIPLYPELTDEEVNYIIETIITLNY